MPKEQRTKRRQIDNIFSSLKRVIVGVSQASIDAPLHFNIFINDLFLFIYFNTLSNYVDDNNLFAKGTDIQLINQTLLFEFKTEINWFCKILMILNPEKCHFMSIGQDSHDEDDFYSDNFTLKNSYEEKILGVTIGRKLTFHQHIKNMCLKICPEFSALLRIYSGWAFLELLTDEERSGGKMTPLHP